MSFGKLRSARLCDTTTKDDTPPPALTSTSRTCLPRRQQLCPSARMSQRSRSLSVNGGSSTSLSVTASHPEGRSRATIQSSHPTSVSTQDKRLLTKRNPSPGDRNRTKMQSRTPSCIPGVRSSTGPAKTSAALKLPRASTPNAAAGISSTTAASVPGTPRTRSPLRSPGRLNQISQVKKPTASPPKAKSTLGTKKDSLKHSSDTSTSSTKNSMQKTVIGDEEVLKELNLSIIEERQPFEKIPHPKEVNIDMQKIGDLLNVISDECFSLCNELCDHRNSILANLIEVSDELPVDELLNEKIANYLGRGDGIFQKYELLKQSQNDISKKFCNTVADLNSETINLRGLCSDLENKLELLESENCNIFKQMKIFSEELEAEREKMTSLTQRRIELEQQIKKHSHRIKELENKSTTSDGKIYQQSTQLKSYEAQLKQKEERYQMLEQKFNHQAKQCRTAGEVREKLEKQRESLEARVSDLKKLKAEQQNESAKVEEKLKKELDEAHNALEKEKQLRYDVEKELKDTHDRLIAVQQKSLELADVSEVTRAIIVQEGSLKTSEKEAQLYTNLSEVQSRLDKAQEEIEKYKKENETLKTAVLQTMESIEHSIPDGEVPSIITVLKSELASKDETIKMLQEQLDTYLKEADARGRNLKELEQKWNEGSITGGSNEDQEAMWQEILELRHRLAQSEKANEKHLQQLTEKQLEVEQRDRVMREQAKVLQLRDELLRLLRKKDRVKAGQITALQTKLDDKECISDLQANNVFSAKAEQLNEIYTTLEMKQRRVMQLEEEVKRLEAENQIGQCQRTRLEARVAELELAVHEKGKTSCAASFYNPRCKSSAYYSPLNCTNHTDPLYRESPALSDYPLNIPPNYPLNHHLSRPHNGYRLLRASRKPYTRLNDKTRSVLQLYKIHSTDWGDSNCSHTTIAIPHCWPYATPFSRVQKTYAH